MALALRLGGVLTASSVLPAYSAALPGLAGWLQGWLRPQQSPTGSSLANHPASPSVHETPYDKNGRVLAAPKKKVSYARRRQRQLSASNAVKQVKNLVRCPSCGHIKRSHTLCMNCVKEIQKVWKVRDAPAKSEDAYSEEGLDPTDLRILYPGRRQTQHAKDLKKRHEYLWSRPRTLERGEVDHGERVRVSASASAARVGPKPMPMMLKKPFKL